MENRDNMNTITIRRCDLHAIFSIVSLGNKSIIDILWSSVETYLSDNSTTKKGDKDD